MNFSSEKPFLSIKDTSTRSGLSQYYIRQRCIDGTIPHASLKEKGFYTEKNKERLRQGFVSGRWYAEDPKK